MTYSEVNYWLFSETHSSGKPRAVSRTFSLVSIVPASGMFVKLKISGHFEKESTMTSRYWLYSDPQKSM